MLESSLKRYAPFAAVLGLVGLLAAAVIWLLQRQFNTAVQVSLAVGLLGLALALLFNPAAVQTWLGGRQARYGSNVLVMILAMLGIVSVVNFLVYRNPQSWDWSEDRTNTLANETMSVLRELDQPARAVAFYTPNLVNARSTAERLLERYRVASGGLVTYEFHDPQGEPALAQQYNITRDGTIVVEMGGSREELAFASEDEMTAALIRLMNPTERVVYFLTGHGERETSGGGQEGLSTVANLLQKQNYVLQPLNLQVTTTVPADATALVIAGPQVPVTQAEVDIIKQYTDGGGALVVLMDPALEMTDPEAAHPLLDYLRTSWGVTLNNDIVVDFGNSFPNQPLFPLNSGYGNSPITRDLQNIASVYPAARTVQIPAEGQALPNLFYTALVPAAESAWGETNFDSLSTGSGPQLDEADTQPPVNLAVAVENTDNNARLVVFGDSNFASDAAATQGANALLFTKTISWVAAQETLISLTPRVPTQRSLVLTDAFTVNAMLLLTVIVPPLLVAVVGGVVWWQRRRHT